MRNLPFIHLGYSVSMFICACFCAWCLLSYVDFFYPTLYQWLDIQATVMTYGSQNRYKEGFEHTLPTQHFEYFSQLITAINHGGVGLRAIEYPFNGQSIQLLRHEEIVHLEDVSKILNIFFTLTTMAIALVLLLIWHMSKYKKPLPSVKQQSIQMVVLIGGLVSISAVIGFERVFYWLHRIGFPADHEWFFYYQDSLMTTMMKAPILFGPIAALLIVMSGVIFIVINYLAATIYDKLLT